jgi:hypothetical protein
MALICCSRFCALSRYITTRAALMKRCITWGRSARFHAAGQATLVKIIIDQDG